MKERLLQVFAENVLWYGSQKFIESDYAKKYDKDNLFKLILVTLTFSLANGIKEQYIDDECAKKVIRLLKAQDVDLMQIEISECNLTVDDFVIKYKDFVEREYEVRYCLMEAILYIFQYNGKNIKDYQDIIKLARFLKFRKGDFVYLYNKYKGE